jgi:hypothetical protein
MTEQDKFTKSLAATCRVFISYSHDSTEHEQRVLALANQLRADGIEAWIDQYVQDPEEGWIKWMRTQVKQAEKVLLVFTKTYQKRFEGDEEEGKGMGATFEGVIVTQALYESGGRNAKFRPVVFEVADERFIPLELRRFNRYRVDTPDHYQNLLRWLHAAPWIVPPDVGPKPDLPPKRTSESFPSKPSKAQGVSDGTPNSPSDAAASAGSSSREDEIPLSWRRAVVRVWCGSPRDQGRFLGSAFFVSSDKLLTASHLFDNVPEAQMSELMLEGPALEGGLRAIQEVHPHQSADAAALVAAPGLSASPELWIPWQEDIKQGLARGEKLTLVGYGSDEMTVETATAFVRDEDGTTGLVMLSGPVASGMSGGPVFAGVRLVGITHANDINAGGSYVVPITRVQELFKQFGITPVALAVGQHHLQEYPLFVPFGTERLNPSLWKGYANVIRLGEEIEVIYKANQERLAADPNLDEAYLLHEAQLPDPSQNRMFFWQMAFQIALRRSGRMLAALLLAVDENQLPPDAASARRELLEALRREAKKQR